MRLFVLTSFKMTSLAAAVLFCPFRFAWESRQFCDYVTGAVCNITRVVHQRRDERIMTESDLNDLLPTTSFAQTVARTLFVTSCRSAKLHFKPTGMS